MVGLDIGTSYLISARAGKKEGSLAYKMHRDAFFRIKPATPIAGKMIESGLKGKQYFRDTETGDFIVIGQDAIEKAVERNTSASRPLHRGVISPTEKDALPILKFIIRELVGQASTPDEVCVYSVPAQPIDQPDDQFDTGYHEDVMGNTLRELGYRAVPLNEAEAVAYAETMDDGLTCVSTSWGAGMVNFVVMSSGEPIVKASLAKSGDYIDRMVSVATHQPDTVVQLEKESDQYNLTDLNPANPTHKAIVGYYRRLIEYFCRSLEAKLNSVTNLPKFQHPIPFVVSGGTSLAPGFIDVLRSELAKCKFPFQISEVRLASDQLRAVATGLYLASTLN